MATATKIKPAAEAKVNIRANVPVTRKILPKDFVQADFAYNRWSVTLPVGWTFNDTMDPDFWSNVAHLLAPSKMTNTPARVGDFIEVRTEDHSFYAELYVRAVREQSLIVAPVSDPVYFGKDVPSRVEGMHIRYNTQKRKYEVLRDTDNAVVGDGFDLKENAVRFIEKMKD